MTEYTKPLPRPRDISRPFWDAARDGRLIVQSCTACGHAQHPPRPHCLNCWSKALEWREASGLATIYSCTTAWRSSTRGFRDETPYVVAIVETDEGARMTTNIVGCPPDQVEIGQRVRVLFERANDEISIPKFTPENA